MYQNGDHLVRWTIILNLKISTPDMHFKSYELYGKEFAWKFFATSHGKGVVDGVGGSLKSYMRRRVLSPGENAPIVDNAESFFNVATHNARTTVIHTPTGDMEHYKTLATFSKSVAIDGIFKMHILNANETGTRLWRNTDYAM